MFMKMLSRWHRWFPWKLLCCTTSSGSLLTRSLFCKKKLLVWDGESTFTRKLHPPFHWSLIVYTGCMGAPIQYVRVMKPPERNSWKDTVSSQSQAIHVLFFWKDYPLEGHSGLVSGTGNHQPAWKGSHGLYGSLQTWMHFIHRLCIQMCSVHHLD